MTNLIKINKIKPSLFIVPILFFSIIAVGLLPQPNYAQAQSVGPGRCAGNNCQNNNNNRNQNNRGPGCGKGESRVPTKINLGCNGANKNPIIDFTFALIRFLSIGVGVVVIASIVFAGIQYTTSEGNPEKTQEAKERIRLAITALIIYLFIFAIVQYLVPGGLF